MCLIQNTIDGSGEFSVVLGLSGLEAEEFQGATDHATVFKFIQPSSKDHSMCCAVRDFEKGELAAVRQSARGILAGEEQPCCGGSGEDASAP